MKRRHADDPALTGGQAIGVGGPKDRNAVVYDTRNAVVVEGIETSVAHSTHRGKPAPRFGRDGDPWAPQPAAGP